MAARTGGGRCRPHRHPGVGACRAGYQRVLRIDLSTLAICHSVPAGSAVGLGVGYRLFTGAGVIPAAAVMTKATQASARRTS